MADTHIHGKPGKMKLSATPVLALALFACQIGLAGVASAQGGAQSKPVAPAQQLAAVSAQALAKAGIQKEAKPVEKVPEHTSPANGNKEILKGSVTASPSPLLYGSVQSLPAGTKVDLVLTANLNSELSQKGDEVLARLAIDVKDGSRVLLPGGWYVHGVVSNIAGQKRLGRDGFVEIEFDTLVSPDGNYELPFEARLSTKDNQLKSIAKTLAIDSAYVTEGAAGGAILSVQLTGLPVAIASHGYSVAIGAGVGAGLGAIGALKRKGKIASFYPGDEIKLTIAEPITLPGFNPDLLPSAAKIQAVQGLDVLINHYHFARDPLGDNKARILTVDVLVDNHTRRMVSFFDLAVVSDHNQRYYPSALGNFEIIKKKIGPQSSAAGTVTFSVDSPKRKYWLVVLDRGNREELKRVPIN